MLMSQVQIVETIMEFGADPNEKCKIQNVSFEGYTFLQYAAFSNYSLKKQQIAQILISHGADLNTPQVESPLWISVRDNNLRFAI